MPFKQIDWEEQWTLYAKNFKEGKARICLPAGKEIFLEPGPGFGDLSHPTTQLVLEMMLPWLSSHSYVVDIGCGSGILSLAAASLGAKGVFGYDTDPSATIHAQKNAQINGLSSKTLFTTSPKNYPFFPENPLVLMNMISSEQEKAWEEVSFPYSLLITSGILQAQREPYLTQAAAKGWNLLREESKEGWLGFIFN